MKDQERWALQDKRELEYRQYIDKHINNVGLVWNTIQRHCTDEFWLDDAIYTGITMLINRHDLSKYSDQEFDAYRRKFFPVDGEPSSEIGFNYAVHHHYQHNPHHWQYWIGYDQKAKRAMPLSIPFSYIIEMLCDWTAMSVDKGGTPTEFFESVFHLLCMVEDDQLCIRRWLPVFEKALLDILEKRGTP